MPKVLAIQINWQFTGSTGIIQVEHTTDCFGGAWFKSPLSTEVWHPRHIWRETAFQFAEVLALNQQLKVSTFSSVCAVFSRPLPAFHSVADPRSSTRLQIAFTEQSFQPFSGNFATIVRYPKPSFHSVLIWALSLYYILPITKVVIRLIAIILWLEISKNLLQCYVACKQKIMMSQQRWYLLLSYFNNKIRFIVLLWNSLLKLPFPSIWCQVNTAQSNTLVQCTVLCQTNEQNLVQKYSGISQI